MRCPFCKAMETSVIDTRLSGDGYSIRRRRQCEQCSKRFTTFERAELNMPSIVKRTGARRDYDREKVRSSMQLALRKRPVAKDSIEAAIAHIEQQLRTLGERDIPSSKVGELVLEELKRLDKVAYLRFASVYFNVADPEGLRRLMQELEQETKEN
ncbi:MAG: transcriptional repressor NrdR [Duodenibacillus sp.]|nr:transcriptional repressor NrdR [Duodenibacillus sp.]